jgi:type VI secretion system protein ImpJ
MGVTGEVHWHEGLFLRPHHLQLLQRQIGASFARHNRFAFAYPYGLIECRMSPDALENMLIRFDRLRVFMPSGVEVDVPGNADLPPLNIKPAFESQNEPFLVSLGVPLWRPEGANTSELGSRDDWRVKNIYHVAEAQVADENTGDNVQPVALRRINARLLLPGDDQTDLECLPLLKITRAAGEQVGLPRVDPAYLPPCLVLGGSAALLERLRDLANQVEASRNELVLQINQGGFSIEAMRGVQFEQSLRLRTLNRFSARLTPLILAPNVSPFEIYVELRQLLAELAALQPDRDPFETAPYNHDNPALAFGELSDRIRALLRGTVAAKFLQVKFVRAGRVVTAALSDEHLTMPNEYFLGVRTRMDPAATARLVEDADQFQMSATSMASKRIFGVKLAEERHPPLALPAQAGLHYFRLMRTDSKRMWEQIKTEKSISIRWPDLETSDFDLTLYMTVPS